MPEALRFFAAEVEVYRPGAASAMVGFVWGEAPIGAEPPAGGMTEDSTTLLASDVGYVTPLDDPAGTLVYVPTLAQAIAVDRSLALGIGGAGAAVAWGGLRLIADAARYTDMTSERNVDSRNVRVLMGRKPRDLGRGLWLNPAYADLVEVFAGMAQDWRPDESGITIPVRDASVWMERQLQSNVYAGTGGIEGTAELKGRPRPKLRGGRSGAPVHNISPVLIDPVANIWQFNDGPADLNGALALYENGKAVFSYAGPSVDLWGDTPPDWGEFKVDTSKGLFRLGSPTLPGEGRGQITLDAFSLTGGVAVSNPVSIALALMTDDLEVPAESIDTASFTALATEFASYDAGWYWDGASPVEGADAVGLFLASIGARLVPTRSGKLRAMALRAVAPGTVPAASYTTDQIVSMRRAELPAGLSPPPYRIRWGYNHNHTIMTSNVNATVDEAQKAFLAEADRFGQWSSSTVLTAYRRPSDPDPLTTALVNEGNATAIAAAMGALWGVGRRLYRVELPIDFGLLHEIGDVLMLAYPLDRMDSGALALVVGEQFRSQDDIITLTVLV